MSKIIDKMKNALHSDTPEHHRDHAEDVPGSFPDERAEGVSGNKSDRHKDGGQYIAPSGTAVGAHGAERSSAEGGASSTLVDNRNLMDPADRGHGSNVMTTTGAAGDPLTSAERTTTATSGSHHNKLQKSRDPRGQEIPTGAGGYTEPGQSGYQDVSGQPRRTSGALRHQDGYEDLHGGGSDRHVQYQDTAGRTSTGGLAGAGLASGAAGGMATRDLPERQHHPQSTTTTSRDAYASDIPAGHDNRSYGQGVYNTVTGAGSGEPYDRAPTQPHHGGGAGATAGATAAAATAAGAGVGHHQSGQRDYDDRPAQWPLGGDSSVDRKSMAAGAPIDDTTTSYRTSGYQSEPRGHDPRMAPSGVSGPTATHSTSGVGGVSHGHDTRGVSNTAGTGGSGLAAAAAAAPVSGGGTSSAPGAGPEHYGPGHAGSKVMHQCTNCGHDNDITHYFGKSVTYRIG